MKKGGFLSFVQTWIPFTQGCFLSILVEIGSMVLEKKMKMWKVYRRTTDRQTDGWMDRRTMVDRWSEKLTWAFSSGELKITLLTWSANCYTINKLLQNYLFKDFSNYNRVLTSLITFPWRRTLSLLWTYLNPLHQRMQIEIGWWLKLVFCFMRLKKTFTSKRWQYIFKNSLLSRLEKGCGPLFNLMGITF